MLRAARLVAAEARAVALEEAADRAEGDREEVLRAAQERARRVHDRLGCTAAWGAL